MSNISSKSDLINYFEQGCKKESQLKIGVEHEKFLFNNKQKRADFKDISQVFNYLGKFGWKPIKENNHVIALSNGDKSITLEPGNQIELSGAPLASIHLTCNESYKFLDEIKKATSSLNLRMMSTSFDPFSKIDEIPNNPKQRYQIMNEEMPKFGELSLEMMYKTCGTQINLDYISEKDFSKKFKLASSLVPLSIAIFANSPIKEKKLNGYLSYRSKVWQKTSRGGLPKVFFEDINFEKYVDMAINMPLLFVNKKLNYHKVNGETFKNFMEGKLSILNKESPTIKDFEIHLATIFKEVRLKKYIEIRSLDTCEWDCHCSGPAFYTGLLYGKLNDALAIVNKWKVDDILNAYIDAPKKGLKTIINNKTLLEWGKIFLNFSREGLEKRAIKNNNNSDETIFLRSIENILNKNKTKAEIAINNFKTKKDLDFLYEKK